MPKLSDALKPPANLENMEPVLPPAGASNKPPSDSYSMPGFDSLSAAPTPPVLSTSSDQQRQFYRRGVSQIRTSPLPSKANPATNAATRSVVAQVIASTPSTTPPVSIFLTMPPEYAVAGSPADANGGFDVTWVPETSGFVLGVPAGGDIGLDGATGTGAKGAVIDITTAEPSSANEWALYAGEIQVVSATAPPVGWTALFASASIPIYYRAVTDTNPVNVTQTLTGTNNWSGVIALFGGAPPTFVQSAQASIGGVPTTATLPGVATAGNGLLIVIQGFTSIPVGRSSLVLGDLQGNPILIVGSAFTSETVGASTGSQTAIYYIPSLQTGSESVTVIPFTTPLFGTISIYEVTPFTPVTGIPRFMGLPPIDLGIDGAGGVFGNLPVSHLNNGLNADATTFWNGAGLWTSVFYQTVLRNGVAQAQRLKLNFKPGLFVTDNAGANSTEVSIIGGQKNLTGQTGSIGSTVLHFAQTDALFRVSYDLITTTADVAGTVSLTLTWPNGSATKTFTIPIPLDLTTLGDEISGSVTMWVPVGSNILYETTAAGISGTPAYSLQLRTESMG